MLKNGTAELAVRQPSVRDQSNYARFEVRNRLPFVSAFKLLTWRGPYAGELALVVLINAASTIKLVIAVIFVLQTFKYEFRTAKAQLAGKR